MCETCDKYLETVLPLKAPTLLDYEDQANKGKLAYYEARLALAHKNTVRQTNPELYSKSRSDMDKYSKLITEMTQ